MKAASPSPADRSFAAALQRLWYRLSIWHLILVPVSWLFWLLSTLRRIAYASGLLRSYRLPVPVIVVGNITVGGTGKTPLVIWLALELKRLGYYPAIISRGYGGDARLPAAVNKHSNPYMVGDEPVLLARRAACPVWVGQDRVAVAQALLAMHPECNVIISDDGLQHYRLQRDIEVVLVDGQRQFGNGCLLPAGPLRERPSRLAQVDAVIWHGGDVQHGDADFGMQLVATEFHRVNAPEITATAAQFSAERIYALAGIGHPERFFQQLRAMGLQFQHRAFADHHPFQAGDLQIPQASVILMTEKDAVKCAAFAEAHCWYLPVDAVIDSGLVERIIARLP